MNKLRTRHNRDLWSAKNEQARSPMRAQFDLLKGTEQLAMVRSALERVAPGSSGSTLYPGVDRSRGGLVVMRIPTPEGDMKDSGYSITIDEFLDDQTGSIARLIEAIGT